LRPPYQRSTGLRIGTQRGRAGYDARRRNSSQERHWVPRSGWTRVSAMVLTGVVVAVVAIFVTQKWWRPAEQSVVAAPPAAVVEPEPQPGAEEQKPPDVVSERAAIDAQLNQ